MGKISKVLLIIILCLGIVYLLGLIFKVDINYFTFNRSYCDQQNKSEHTDILDLYIGVDCRTFSDEFEYRFYNDDYYIDLESLRTIKSERDYCEYIHRLQKELQDKIEIQCQKPPFFKQI